MPRAVAITAWSFARWRTWHGCARQYLYRYVQSLDEPPVGPAVKRGGIVHDDAEVWVRKPGRKTKLPDELESFTEEFEQLRRDYRNKKVEVELEGQWAWTKNWAEPIEWFGGALVWVRVKLDAYVRKGTHAQIIDYKTGRVRKENEVQLSLYALAVFEHDPKVKTVSAELWYVDQGVEVVLDYTRADHYDDLVEEWDGRTREMFVDRDYVPRPGPACNWCPWSAAKNGPCEHGA